MHMWHVISAVISAVRTEPRGHGTVVGDSAGSHCGQISCIQLYIHYDIGTRHFIERKEEEDKEEKDRRVRVPLWVIVRNTGVIHC